MDVENEIDRLYELPLGDFTAARNELVRRLRKDGDREAAERVKKLAKPSVSAWAVNQLARNEGARVRALIAAGERLRVAQARLLDRGSAYALQEASGAVRRAVSDLVRPARAILEVGGHAATDAALDRVVETLRAAAVDEEARELLERGRLTRDVDATGFGPLPATPAPGGQPARREPPARDARRKRAESKVSELRAEVRLLESSTRTAERAAAAARRAAGDAESAAERERAKLEKAKERLARAEEALRATG